MSELRKKLQSSKLPPLPAFQEESRNGGVESSGARQRLSQNWTPIEWDQFFDESRIIAVDEDTKFNVYIKNSCGAHESTDTPLLILLHGGGYTGLTWSCFVEEICRLVHCRVIAPDLRGHGRTTTKDEYSLTPDQFSTFVRRMLDVHHLVVDFSDIQQIMGQLYGKNQPPSFLMGHSMGGAVAAHIGKSGTLTNLKGLAVIDVVEGSALDALHGMKAFLRSRPSNFSSLQDAIQWCVKTHTVTNIKSARVSMPSQLKPIMSSSGSADGEDGFTWRTDLTQTEAHWESWFKGLSKLFLSVPVAKLLILAGTDRLDKEMTVGQMQGKFQMVLLNKAGHAVHEDLPIKVAEAIANFLLRHKLTTAVSDSITPSIPAC